MKQSLFWCEQNRTWYETDLYTPVLVHGEIICLEENDLFRWSDGTYHWVSEDWAPHKKVAGFVTHYKTPKERLREALQSEGGEKS
jgi:hypothetical protein